MNQGMCVAKRESSRAGRYWFGSAVYHFRRICTCCLPKVHRQSETVTSVHSFVLSLQSFPSCHVRGNHGPTWTSSTFQRELSMLAGQQVVGRLVARRAGFVHVRGLIDWSDLRLGRAYVTSPTNHLRARFPFQCAAPHLRLDAGRDAHNLRTTRRLQVSRLRQLNLTNGRIA